MEMVALGVRHELHVDGRGETGLDGGKGQLCHLYGRVDVQRLVKLLDIVGHCAGDDPAYDALVEQMADLVSARKSQGEGAVVRLNRALQLPFERNLDMIRMFGRAGHDLVKREYAESFITAMQHLSIAYQSAGLIWAARAATLLALARIAIEGERDGDIDVSLIPTLKVLCWQSLRLRHYPDLLLAYQTLSGALSTLPLSDNSKMLLAENLHDLDMATASTLLNLSGAELVQMEHLPDILAGLDMNGSRLALLYALGYETELRADGSLPANETSEDVATFMSILASQPVSDDLRASFVGQRLGPQTLKTIVLGIEIVVHCDGSELRKLTGLCEHVGKLWPRRGDDVEVPIDPREVEALQDEQGAGLEGVVRPLGIGRDLL